LIKDDGDIELSDEILVRRCQMELPSDTKSYELLVQRHMNRVYTIVYRMIPNREDAEEITQDIFVKVFHSIETFESASAFSTWLYRVAVNSSIDASQKLKRRGIHFFAATNERNAHAEDQVDPLDNQVSAHPGPEEKILQREQRDCINRVFKELDREQMRVLVMRDVEDFSYDEIAASLETGLSAAKMRIHRARLAFQHLFLQLCDQTRLAFSVTLQEQSSSQREKGRRL
jgi:RNA polymerase sigma-70 factor, ECF subfamily